MQISGLPSNFYLSDNPIYLMINEIDPYATYVQVVLTRLKVDGGTDIVSKPQNIYNLSTSVTLDIAPLIKSFMPEPLHNTNYLDLTSIPFYSNSIKAKISVYQYGIVTRLVSDPVAGVAFTKTNEITDTKDTTKYFIRGGKRTYDSNQNLVAAQNLLVTGLIPVWGGYPVDYYLTSATTGIEKLNTIPSNLKEDRTIKGCNPYYVKFMNSLGGYSYWLFENWEEEEGSKNLGSILRQSSVLDLGNDFDSGFTFISKVPQRFLPLMKDLIISKEIYLYDDAEQTWERISSGNNKIKENPTDVNTKVKLKFTKYSRFNPSLIW